MLVRREPDDADGEFYRVLWEGRMRNYDGVTIKVAPPLEGLDLNRNFPMEWVVEAEQYALVLPDVGAGDPRARPGDRRPPEHHRPHRIPPFSGVHLRPCSRLPRRALPDDRPSRLPADRREATG